MMYQQRREERAQKLLEQLLETNKERTANWLERQKEAERIRKESEEEKLLEERRLHVKILLMKEREDLERTLLEERKENMKKFAKFMVGFLAGVAIVVII